MLDNSQFDQDMKNGIIKNVEENTIENENYLLTVSKESKYNDKEKKIINIVTTDHPIEWLLDVLESPILSKDFNFVLLNSIKISNSQFNRFKNMV